MRTDSTARRITFADETPTGADAERLRGLSRVTIAARFFSSHDFTWVDRLRQNHLGSSLEPKSGLVLPIIEHSPAARREVLENIPAATIVIVDLAEDLRSLLAAFQQLGGKQSTSVDETLRFLRGGGLPREVVGSVLQLARQDALCRSAVGRIESLLAVVRDRVGLRAGGSDGLFDRHELGELSGQEFRELVTRFSITLGDALDPVVQAEAIKEKLDGAQICTEAHVAFAYIEAAREDLGVFDVGCQRPFDMLCKADELIEAQLNRVYLQHPAPSAGRLSQDNSHRVLGLQAADIAAGYARQLFEHHRGGTVDAAQAVRRFFSRVMLNTEWLLP